MILPIVAYGHPGLKKKAEAIEASYPNLKALIANMHETMDAANGVGLAAPQVNLPIRLIVINADPYSEEHPDYKDLRKTYINLHIIEEEGEEWAFCEGCLSIPGINEDVMRKPIITIEYDDENFTHHKETLGGLLARVIQHEHDHLEGHVFVEHLSSLRKTLLRKKLDNISKGQSPARYRMTYVRK